jgi:hypothetical protein
MNEEMIARRGADAPAAAKLSTDVATMMKAYRAELSPEEAKKRMTLSGDEKVLDHLLACIVHYTPESEQQEPAAQHATA